ncbi:MAG TPA: ABC transporter permease [Thermoanaerobaculia bacterium]|nr:ABC transporter permease [Thermoanaerobaculia bacterium]
MLRALLRLYPARHRQRFGEEILESCRRAAGGDDKLAVACRLAWDVVWSACCVHWDQLRDGTRGLGASQPAPRPRDPSKRGTTMLAALSRDLRFAFRDLRRAPGVTVAVVGTLALALAADVVVFSLVHSALLRALPYREADRLVRLWESNPEKGWVHQSAAPANFLDWREQTRSFEDIAAYSYFDGGKVTVNGSGEPFQLSVVTTTGNLFTVLGAEPLLGRFFTWDETWDGGENVAVLSHGAWQEHFGGDLSIVGRSVTIEDVPVTVVGVARPGLRLPEVAPEIWGSVDWSPDARSAAWFRRAHFVSPIGRLATGTSPEAADAEIRELAARLEVVYPETNRLMGAGVTPLHAWVVDDSRLLLWTLLAGVSAVLLIACANAAHLLLARAVAREHDLVVLQALGASRIAVVRHVLAESALLAAAAGIVGLTLASVGLRLLRVYGPADLPRLWELEMRPAAAVFAVGLVVVAVALAGLLPALHAAGRSRLAVSEPGRSGGSRSQQRLRRGLVALEVALAVLLVAGGGLFLRSLGSLIRTDTGFDAANVITAKIPLPARRYDGPRRIAFYDEVTERLRGASGVEAVGLVSSLPIASATWTTTLVVEGLGEEGYVPEIQHRTVDTGYFEAMRVPVIAGRDFDVAEPVPAVILNRTAAERHFAGLDPIGRRVAQGGRYSAIAGGEEPDWYVVVGVVEDEVQVDLRTPVMPQMFEPLSQDPRASMTVVVRSVGEPQALAAALRAAVADLDPTIPVGEIAAMTTVLRDSLQRERFLLWITGGFSVFALLLAALGVYGVLSYWVSSRSRELGLLQALGASSGDLHRLVLRQGMTAVALGLVVGLVAALVAGRLVEGLLFEVSASDPVTLGAVVALVSMAALLACVVPARRAARLQPASLIREG